MASAGAAVFSSVGHGTALPGSGAMASKNGDSVGASGVAAGAAAGAAVASGSVVATGAAATVHAVAGDTLCRSGKRNK